MCVVEGGGWLYGGGCVCIVWHTCVFSSVYLHATHTHVHTHPHIRTHPHPHMHLPLPLSLSHTHTYTHTHICMYVYIYPTPPHTDGQVARVVVGIRHPLPHLRNESITALQAAGILVDVLREVPCVAGVEGAEEDAYKACLMANEVCVGRVYVYMCVGRV